VSGARCGLTARETFLVLASSGPFDRADVGVVLMGEDAEPRMAVAATLYNTNTVPLLYLTGGLSDPPRIVDATAGGLLLAHTHHIPPGCILVDARATNTREQSVNAVAEAGRRGWTRMVLVASAYHQFRALLTFVRALSEAEKWDVVRVSLVPSLAPWCQSPVGRTETRAALLGAELAKIEQYGKHVATYQEGIDYLQYWEGAP
jgi:uncharacterized SAM-binding protein YcdF (DUF218 family)